MSKDEKTVTYDIDDSCVYEAIDNLIESENKRKKDIKHENDIRMLRKGILLSNLFNLDKKSSSNNNYESYNFEEEELEDDDYYFEDDK